jgi:hypothetical protein
MSPVGGLLSAEPVSVGVEVGTEPAKGRSVGNATGGIVGGIKTISFPSSFSPAAAGTILDCSELTDKTKHDTIRRQIASVRMLAGKLTRNEMFTYPQLILIRLFASASGCISACFRVTLSGL